MKKRIILSGLLFCSLYSYAQKTEVKEKKLQEVVIQKNKKAVEQKADRTIFDFSEQAHLNNGNLMEGIKKLPGMVYTDVAGMMYQGKQLDVFMDGRPLNITSNELTGFLEGMPANSVERIEIITQPGAEFPATSGGAILNIITSKAAKNYLTATYSGNYSFTNEEKIRSRTNNSLNLNAKNALFGWQLSIGQSYREGKRDSFFDTLTDTHTELLNRGMFAKAAVTFDLGMDRLILNYDYNKNNNDYAIDSRETFNGLKYARKDYNEQHSDRQEAALTYQKRFDDVSKKLDFKAIYTNSQNDFSQQNITLNKAVLDNSSQSDNATVKVDYSQEIPLLQKGKISVGGLYERLQFNTFTFGSQNLDYRRQTVSSYAEVQTSYKKFDFTAGVRAEDYDMGGRFWGYTDTGLSSQPEKLKVFNQFRLFPNASVQYKFMPMVSLSFNYNKKIRLPSISMLNPNSQDIKNANILTVGNPVLKPTIYDNYEVKLSAFDYAFIGYSLSSAQNQIMNILYRNNGVITNKSLNIPQARVHNFQAGIPLPLKIFTSGLKETMKFNFNPDKINFFYFYISYMKMDLQDIKTKGFWIANVMGQFLLPADIKLVANMSYMTKGNYYYYFADHPYANSLDITLSKKFLNDRLNVSIFANDVLNGSKMLLSSNYNNDVIRFGSDWDSRVFGVSVNYKIPTRNKLAKVDPNLLNEDTPAEDRGVVPGM